MGEKQGANFSPQQLTTKSVLKAPIQYAPHSNNAYNWNDKTKYVPKFFTSHSQEDFQKDQPTLHGAVLL